MSVYMLPVSSVVPLQTAMLSPLAIVVKNCGIGPGGFQQRNTCARGGAGGGGGGGGSKPVLTEDEFMAVASKLPMKTKIRVSLSDGTAVIGRVDSRALDGSSVSMRGKLEGASGQPSSHWFTAGKSPVTAIEIVDDNVKPKQPVAAPKPAEKKPVAAVQSPAAVVVSKDPEKAALSRAQLEMTLYKDFKEFSDPSVNSAGKRWQDAALSANSMLASVHAMPSQNWEVKLVDVAKVKPNQSGDDYVNDSSKYTAETLRKLSKIDKKVLTQGEDDPLAAIRLEDMNPIAIKKDGGIVDGNHRHAAATMNGETKILAFVPVGPGDGKIVNMKEAFEALKSGKAPPSANAPKGPKGRKSLGDDAWVKNCGTGDGGFKPGNTCAAGGSSSLGGGWSPSMSSADAAEWSKGSAYKGEAFHVTTDKTAAGSIKSGGFRDDLKAAGKAFGTGVYIATDKRTADYYTKLFKEEGHAPETLSLKVNVKNPLTIDTTKWNDLERDVRIMPSVAAKKMGQKAAFVANKGEISKHNEGVLSEFNKTKPKESLPEFKRSRGFIDEVDAEAFKRTVVGMGHDSVIVKDRAKIDGTVGGNQLIVFDKKSVVVVENKTKSFDDVLVKNCGTGGGGFKPGNTCAKGGGLSAGFDTRMRYREADGRYYDERFELHRQIIKDTIGDSIPVKNPVATFLGGGTASGKSSLLKSGKAGGKNAVVVDPDAIKEQIPEYQQWKSAGNKGAASNVHLESVDVAKAVTKVALKKGHHVVVDRVGDTGMAYLQDSVDKARAAGATKVIAHYTTTDIGTALDRARERAEQTGRYVPQSYIRESHANVARILPQAMSSSRLFDQATLWDTTNGLVKVASSVSGKMKIHNQDLWDRFVDSGRRG